MKIDWHFNAQADLRRILAYLADRDVSAALGVYEEIDRILLGLAENPKMGRAGRLPGTRELVISGTPYIAVYQVQGQFIQIQRLLHGAQNWPP
jgi:toxin ParE1/3/4